MSRHKHKAQASNGSGAVDAVVVGAGVIGLSCAWRMAQRGLRVRVLERTAPGAGASGVAAGMIAPVGEAVWGEEAILELALASGAAWPGFAAELAEASDEAVGYQRCGALHVALDRDEAEELRRRHSLHRELGLDAEWLLPRECRQLEPGLAPAAGPGVHAPGDAAVDPRRLIAALRTAAIGAGVDLRVGAEVVEGVFDGERLAGVRTREGEEHRAAVVVLAAGCWSAADWLPELARPPVRPVKGQVLTLGGGSGGRVCERIVVTQWVYLVPRDDGRLVVGATVEERGFDVSVTAGGVYELLREAYRVLPEIAELELLETAAGLRPGTPDNLPLIGAGEVDGLIVASGHWRHGVMLAPITADAVATLAVGEEPPVSLERVAPTRFGSRVEVAAS